MAEELQVVSWADGASDRYGDASGFLWVYTWLEPCMIWFGEEVNEGEGMCDIFAVLPVLDDGGKPLDWDEGKNLLSSGDSKFKRTHIQRSRL